MSAREIITFVFDGDELLTVRDRDGVVFVAVKPIADALGLDWRSQRARMARDPILTEGRVTMTIPSQGGPQETVCLRLDLIHGWLFTIDHDRVKPELRERVLLYKRHCYAALNEYFHGPRPRAASLEDRPLADRFLLSRPLPPMLTRSRANRIRHWRAMHDQALAALIHLGDEIGGEFLLAPDADEPDAHEPDDWEDDA